jgi:DNA (cytosine-5)-methyltransferase 1
MELGFEDKRARVRGGKPPRLLDLFSGCGGLALGFVSAGCVSIGGVEVDKDASRSYATNFHTRKDGSPDEHHAWPKSILGLKPRALLRELERRSEDKGADLIVGGPPCPAYTRVGRAKLREVFQHPQAFKHDPRATLYVQYLEYVRALKPMALLMENVPEILNWGGHNLGDEICESLEAMGYRCAYTLLNASNYGVPQMRERFFLMAIHRTVGSEPGFPKPTRRVNLPPGYTGTRNYALKNVSKHGGGKERSWYIEPPAPDVDAPEPVTAREALADLPPLMDHLRGLDRRGPRSLEGNLPYGETPPSAYARCMRQWPGFSSDERLRDHVTRCLTERDYRLFARLEPGADYPKAHALATALFKEELARLRREGRSLRQGTREYYNLRDAFIPPYDPGKFPNKWRKLEADAPARTLMAHLGKDTYSHIHYDSEQSRVISVREAARLQSFPDGFRFSGRMNAAFRQIGNSVPPLLAWAIADELLQRLGARARVPFHDPLQTPPLEGSATVRVA